MLNRSAAHLTARWLCAFVVVSLIGSSLLQRYLGHTMSVPNLDFYDYYFEAAMVHDSLKGNMYSAALHGNPQLQPAPLDSELHRRAEAAGFDGTDIYCYPPLLADLLIPAAVVPPRLAAALWRVLNLVIVALCLIFIARFIGIPLLSAELCMLLLASYSFWPVHENIAQGQISIVLLGLWTIAIISYFEGKVVLSAAALAIATWLKVTPVLIVPVFFIWKDRKWISSYLLAGTGLGLLMVVLNGWHNMVFSIRVLLEMSGSVPALQNKCIDSLVAWIHYGEPATYERARFLLGLPQPHGVLMLGKLLNLAFYVGCLFLVWRRRLERNRMGRAVVIAVFALAIAVIAPVSWRHGYAVSLVLLILLWADALRSSAGVVRLWLLALTTFSLGTLFFDLAAQLPMPAALRIVCAATWTVSSLLLSLEVLCNGLGRPGPGNALDTGSFFENRDRVLSGQGWAPDPQKQSVLG